MIRSKKLILSILSYFFYNAKVEFTFIKQTYSKIVFLIIFSFILTSCQNDSSPSFLVISFEHLPSNAINCSDDFEIENSGYKILCQEFARFTHAYTPSTQPAASIASTLTGLSPFEHQLHRSFDQMMKKEFLIQKKAKLLGYRTSFHSGSPHILKKTGLSHYFDLFDDSVAVNNLEIFKNFKTLSSETLNWISESTQPFFSVIFSSELSSIYDKNTNTPNIDKLDEDMYSFFKKLKTENKWDRTFVFVLGLNGNDHLNRLNENEYSNLHSENTRVTLFVKPPRTQGDDGISWKIDHLITLEDVGFSIHSYFDSLKNIPNSLNFKSIKKQNSSELNHINIFQVLNLKNTASELNLTNSREIISIAPNTWLKNNFKISFIKKDSIIIYSNSQLKKFNLLTDQFEENSLELTSSEEKEITEKTNLILENYSQINFNKYLIPKDDFEPTIENLKNLIQQNYLKKIFETKFKSCFIKNKYEVSFRQINLCENELHRQYLYYKYAYRLNLNEESEKLIYFQMKKRFFEKLKIHSLNFKLQNIWGIKQDKESWVNSVMYDDLNFFTHR